MDIKKGIACAYPQFTQDRINLGINWWYVWGISPNYFTDPTYVPMMRTGLETNLPQDYDNYCLIFNEPEFKEPNGIGISVDEMVNRYENAIYHHSKTKFVVGGVAYTDYKVLDNFKNKLIQMNIEVPDYWHVHAYVNPMSKVKFSIDNFKKLGGNVWISEFGVPSNNRNTLKTFEFMIKYFQSQDGWIDRYAAFTNRQEGSQGWEIGSGCNLCDWNTGNLTAIGKYYASI